MHDFLLLHGLAPRLDPSVITPIPLWRGLKQVSPNLATGKKPPPEPQKRLLKKHRSLTIFTVGRLAWEFRYD
jgi:hypothetical protein